MRPELILLSWWRTRWAMRQSTSQLERRRAHLWSSLQPWIARTPALATHYGKPLAHFPVVDPSELRADFGAWNSCGKSDSELRDLADAAEAGEQVESDLSAGWSTGSSAGTGNRGLFLSNGAERADYVGQSLARLLPGRMLLKRQRLALHLRASNSLYSDVKRGRFDFTHIPLEKGEQEVADKLKAFSPTILIAPPHRLLGLAKLGLKLPDLRYLFSGSEPISEAERDHVKGAFGVRPRSIYQATEGFLAAECAQGRLHLNEHAIEFDLEPVAGTDGFRPILTDLRRKSQPIVRLRGDDFLELDSELCPCGFAGRVIHPPQGRVSDLWHISGRVFTPREVVCAVEAGCCDHTDWQAVGTPNSVTLRFQSSSAASISREAVKRLERLTGLQTNVTRNFSGWTGPKRRKVVWADG